VHVPRGVGDDELALGRGEVPVSDVDGDALLAFGLEPVGEQREVRILVTAIRRGLLHRCELVFEDGFRVEQQAPDQRGLAVVDAARGGDAQ